MRKHSYRPKKIVPLHTEEESLSRSSPFHVMALQELPSVPLTLEYSNRSPDPLSPPNYLKASTSSLSAKFAAVHRTGDAYLFLLESHPGHSIWEADRAHRRHSSLATSIGSAGAMSKRLTRLQNP
jgi:hypothetical protein